MGYDLIQSNNYWAFNPPTWRLVISLAQLGGWQPAGTKLDYLPLDPDKEPIDWDGSYFGNNGQFVTDEDARALADGLESWLNCTTALDIFDPFDEKIEASESTEVFKCLIDERLRCHITEPCDRTMLRVFRGEEIREHFRIFARFCRRGGFSIY